MKTIYKYTLDGPRIKVSIPEGAEFLSLQMQHGIPATWWLVDVKAPPRIRELVFIGTGQQIEMDCPCKFLGTIQMEEGRLVFHLFELNPE